MGVTAAGAEFLIQARHSGIDFGKTLTLGRQNLCVSPLLLERLLKQYDCWQGVDRKQFREKLRQAPHYADGLLEALGAKSVSAMDMSDFEGADIIHDLNVPIPEALHETFDVIVDGGLLEHVFNAPVALKNCMDLVKLGGHLIFFSPANNFFGHGFYQFSPLLFFRVLCPENGFEVQRLHVLENDIEFSHLLGLDYLCETSGPRYAVKDPVETGGRNLLINDRPVMLFVQAKKIARKPIFTTMPQESGYAAAWKQHQEQKGQIERPKMVPLYLMHLRLTLLGALASRLNPFQRRRLYRDWNLRNCDHYRLIGSGEVD